MDEWLCRKQCSNVCCLPTAPDDYDDDNYGNEVDDNSTWFTNITLHKNKHVIIMSSIQATSPSESVQVGTTPVKTEGLDACTQDTKNNMQIHVKSIYI